MKAVLYIWIIITGCLVWEHVLAQDTAPSAHEASPYDQLKTDLEELTRREDRLRDRQTARIMEIEDSMTKLRKDLEQRMTELERILSQEQSIIKEYIEITKSDISSLQSSLNKKTRDTQSLAAEIEEAKKLVQDLSASRKDLLTNIEQSLEERNQAMDQRIAVLEEAVDEHQAEIKGLKPLNEDFSDSADQLNQLEKKISQLSTMVNQIVEEHRTRINEVEKESEATLARLEKELDFNENDISRKVFDTEEEVGDLKNNLYNYGRYAIIVLAVLALTTLIALLAGLRAAGRARLASRQVNEKNLQLEEKFQKQADLIDSRLIKILEKQIPLLPDKTLQDQGASEPADHVLAIALGEEIYNIMKRRKELSLDSEAFEPVKRSLRKMWSTFKDKGYEVVDFHEKPYSKDMEAEAEFILTHELLPGEQIVSRVKRPLIKYKGKTIQKARIDVLVGE